ncbi:MAG: hypothetical protein V1698_00050 [bacterium]
MKLKSKFIILSAVMLAFFAFASFAIVKAADIESDAYGETYDSGGGGGGGTINFGSPIEPKTVPALVDMISTWLSGVVGGVAVLMIMYGGFRYVTSAGNPNNVKEAIGIIKSSVIGLVIIFGANIIMSEVNALLYGTESDNSFFNFVERAIPWFFGLIVGISVLVIIFAGFKMMTAGVYDSKEVESAKKMIQYVVIGLVVTSLSAAIVKFVVSVF